MPSNQKYLIVIVGPTAVGKSKICLKLAEKYQTEIINADSRQIYKELTIGTAKPNQTELDQVKHHFVNHISIHDEYNASIYEQEAISKIEEIFKTKNIAILSGGTGLYIKAVLEGFDSLPDIPKEVFDSLESELAAKGLPSLLTELKEKDPEYFNKVDQNNGRRIVRALAHIRFTNQKFSIARKGKMVERNFNPVGIILDRPREELYTRINARVDQMLKEGLVNEAKELYPFKELRSLRTVGYQELFDYFEGKIELVRAVELIKQNSRRYAKRQMTWNRSLDWKHFHPDNLDKIEEHLAEQIN